MFSRHSWSSRIEPDQAAAAFREALRLDPRHGQAQLELSRLELAAGRTDASVSLAEQAIRIDPESVEAYLTLARGLTAQGELARADPIMERLVKRFPRSAAVLSQMGELKLRRGDPESARRFFAEASAIEPNSTQAVAGLIAIDLSQRKPSDGIARAQQLVSRNPKNVQALLLAARTYMAAGSPLQAEDALRRALQTDGSQVEVYAMLGQLFTSQRRLDDARKEFEGLARRQPRSVQAHTMVATLLEAQGRADEARKRYELILTIDSEAPIAANNLAWMQAESNGNLDVALQLAQTASRGLPDDPFVSDTLGWVYYKKNLANLAIPPLRRSVEKAPDNAVVHFHLGLAYAKTGDTEKARSSLERALKLQPDFPGAEEARRVLGGLRG